VTPQKSYVLILSADATLAALLGALVELEGYEPLFPRVDETADVALTRLRPRASVVDGKFLNALNEVFYARAKMLEARVILLSPLPLSPRLRELVDRYGFTVLTLPLDREAFSKSITDAMAR
jgi:hypothetical protein